MQAFHNNPIINDNFHNWFENSKGIDQNGKPQVYYHKSRHDVIFDYFKYEDVVKNEFNDCYGFYFVADHHKHHVDYIGNGLDYYVFLKMVNPFIFNDDSKGTIIDCNGEKYPFIDINVGFVNALKDKGYDSIIINCPLYYNQYVVFCSHQIKSINNNGEYSTSILNMFQ